MGIELEYAIFCLIAGEVCGTRIDLNRVQKIYCLFSVRPAKVII